METKLDSAFMLACRLLKWTITVPVDSKSHFPIIRKKYHIYKNLATVLYNML